MARTRDGTLGPLQAGTLPDLPSTEVGLPIFDTDSRPSDRYIDEESSVSAIRLAGGELVVRLGNEQPLRRICQVGSDLFMGFSDDRVLKEVRLGPLSADDWEDIDAFSHAGD
jgi:hypothetical protein